MKIQHMFEDDINRKINGVIKVDQMDETTERELQEYVITRELKKHFITFFNYYGDAFAEPTADIGVWISGFFGSGKSHFLKMLSYILANQSINGVKTVERFRKKFADDPAAFMLIDNATRHETETILFNIDIEGFSNKDETAVLRVFAKMFYKHLGFHGEDLKVAKLEQFIAKQGKTEEFRRVFEEKNGAPWLETRDTFGFFEDDVVETLTEVLGMSETAARNWFNGTETAEISIAQLVAEIKEYVDTKPKNFRLLFMADEVGQYVGTDRSLLLNLQSIVEKVGSECGGRVWIICTGQEAIDEIIKVRMDEFSRIQARFRTRLSLSSSAVDEVIQKRLLKKTPEAENLLDKMYKKNEAVLHNLFSFTDAILDIKGHGDGTEFLINYPFVPYQFILIQKIFSEIRKHGAAGKHYSGAERSMLDGFQIVAKAIQDRDEYALAPLYPFYDSVHTFLDGSIRRVIERCQKAADKGDGIEDYDVKVLKLLYLVRYVDDIKSSLDNLVILMADDLRAEKIDMRLKVQKSLDRLKSQNYIDRRGDTYVFLTDEEQDIAREIAHTLVDTAEIVEQIGKKIFGDIYTVKKYRYGRYDFPFDRMVDSMAVGSVTGGMVLQFLTMAADAEEKMELHLMTVSKGRAIVVLAETPYYEYLENAKKIRKYIRNRNVNQLPKTVQDIISAHQDEADRYEADAGEALIDAIAAAEFYADGEHLDIRGGTPTAKIEQALEYLVTHVYSGLNFITQHAETDADIRAILNGTDIALSGMEHNREAAVKMEEYLEVQHMRKLPTSMADVQSRYQAVPYGWKEIDVAAVTALLIQQQKVTIKYGGATIRADNPKLVDMLRKKSEIGRTSIAKKQSPSAQKMRAAKSILQEYFDISNVPQDEDGLVSFIIEKFTERRGHYKELLSKYEGKKYPDKAALSVAVSLLGDILAQQNDNIALVEGVVAKETDLLDSKEDLYNVEKFFANQVAIFDAAVKLEYDLRPDLSAIQQDKETNDALSAIRKITLVDSKSSVVYEEIPKLNGLMMTVNEGYGKFLADKRDELLEVVRQCMAAIHTAVDTPIECKDIITKADDYYTQMKEDINSTKRLLDLDGFANRMWGYKDDALKRIEARQKPVPRTPQAPPTKPASSGTQPSKLQQTQQSQQPPKKIKSLYRQAVFPVKTLESKEDVEAYLGRVRAHLNKLLAECDGIELL